MTGKIGGLTAPKVGGLTAPKVAVVTGDVSMGIDSAAVLHHATPRVFHARRLTERDDARDQQIALARERKDLSKANIAVSRRRGNR